MADCGSLDDAAAAVDAGADLIGTTLAGYTGERAKTDGPDLDLARSRSPPPASASRSSPRAASTPRPRPARRSTPARYAVVVGTAITHPATITGWFSDALRA